MKLQSHLMVLSMLGSTLAFGMFDFQPSVDPFADLNAFDVFGRDFGLPTQHHRPPARQYKFDEDSRAHYIFLRAPQAEHKSFGFQIDHMQSELMITEHAPHGFNKKFWFPTHVDTASITAEWIERDLLKIVLPKKQQLQPEGAEERQACQHQDSQLGQANSLENEPRQEVTHQRLAERQQQLLQQEQAERQQQLLRQRQAERRQYERQQEIRRQRQAERLEHERHEQLLRQRRAERQQQRAQQERAERQEKLLRQRRAQRQQQRVQQERAQRQQQRVQQEQAERQQQLLRQRQAERRQYARQQEALRQREVERQQETQRRRQVGQRHAEPHAEARSHQRIKHQQALYQEQLMQQQSQQYQQDRVTQRLQGKQIPITHVDKFKKRQVDGVYEDHDSDMLVAEDEEIEIHASPVKLASAVDGYVDTRGIFREY